MKLETARELLVEFANEWSADKVMQVAAAVAYYAIFSLAPLLVIAIAVAGFVFGEQAARGQIVRQIEGAIGAPAAEVVQDVLKGAHVQGNSVVASLVATGVLLFGASGVFLQLQEGLNTIWKVQRKPGMALWDVLRNRFWSFTLVLATGLLLLVLLVANAALAAAGKLLGPDPLPGGVSAWQLMNSGLSFFFVLLLFALIYRLLPDVLIDWKHIWIGSVITGMLFTVGKFLVGLYLAHTSTTSAFGAAGSLAAVLLWLYYSSLVFLTGAEITKAYARRSGARIIPKPNAEWIPCDPPRDGWHARSAATGVSSSEPRPSLRSGRATPPYGD
jgi:membrane protein